MSRPNPVRVSALPAISGLKSAAIFPVVQDGATQRATVGDISALVGQRTVISALDFGVVGDGIADDTAAMQRALDAAADKALSIPGGMTIKCNSGLIALPNTTILGYGASLVKQIGGTHNMLTLANGCRVFGLRMDGLRRFGGGVTGASIRFDDPLGWFEVRDCLLYDGGSNITITACQDAGIIGCRFELGRAAVGLDAEGEVPVINSVRIIGCHFVNLRDEIVDINRNCRTILIQGCTGVGTPTLAGNEGVDIGGNWCEDIIVADCIFRIAEGGNGIITKINGAPQITRRIRVDNCILIYEGPTPDKIGMDLTADDIDLTDSTFIGFSVGITVTGPFRRARVRGCRVRGATHHALQMGVNIAAEDLRIEDNDLETSSTTAACIYLPAGITRFTLRDNTTRGGVSGVRVDDGCTGGEIHGHRALLTPRGLDIRTPDVAITDARLEGTGAAGSIGIVFQTTGLRGFVGGSTRITGFETAISDLAGNATIETVQRPSNRYQPFSAALFGAIATPVVATNGIPPLTTFARSQPSSALSTRIGSDATTWGEIAADVARFQGSAQRLLIEGTRTNSTLNPRAAGAAAGTPGTVPTNWNIAITAAGVSREIIGAVTVNGLPGLRVRFFGTPSATGNLQVQHTPNSVVAASAGQVWASTAFYRLHAGSVTGVTNIRHRTRTAGGANDVLTVLSPAMDGTLRRYGHTLTCNAGTTHIFSEWLATITNGVGLDITIDVVAPQLEIAPAASTPILPATTGASTRNADVVTATLAALGVSASGASTALLDVMIPQAAPSGVDQVIWQMDDGSDNNRIALVNPAGGSTVVVRRTTGGSTVSSTSLGTFTAGVAFRLGLSVDGTGRAAGRLGAGNIQAVTGCVTSGLTTLRVGNNQAGSSALFGEIGNALIAIDVFADETFGALAAGGPRPLRAAQIVGL